MKYKLLLTILFSLSLTGCTLGTTTSPKINQENQNTNSTSNANETVNQKPSGNSLDLSGQNLTKIPDYVFKQTNLEELNISNNNLTGAIQAEIRQLTKLKILNASNNQMTEIGRASCRERV